MVKLDLENNKINEIENKTFVNLISLEELLLSRNHLKFFSHHLFTGLVNLVNLSLESNKIHFIEMNSFANLGNLHILNLNNNDLKILKDNVFFGLRYLKELDLQNNRIHTIQEHTFGAMYWLFHKLKINLRGNMLSELGWNAFSNSSLKLNNIVKHAFKNVKLVIDDIRFDCKRAMCWIKHLNWKISTVELTTKML